MLETAAGTGVLTRAMASRLAADVRIVATDLNQPMLDQAAAQQPADRRLTWQQADALALPFEDRSFDVVACQFGAMFFPDKVQGYREARRVLKPGGRFLFNVWDRIEDNEFADVVTEALAAIFPQDPPRFMARTPHGYHDAAKIRERADGGGICRMSRSMPWMRAQQGALAAASGDCLLPGHAAAKRDRGARRVAAGGGDQQEQPTRWRAIRQRRRSMAASGRFVITAAG